MEEYDARLENWIAVVGYDSDYFVIGHIFGDSKKRFDNGTIVHTSGCFGPPPKEGDVIQTRNSRYKLGMQLKAYAF